MAKAQQRISAITIWMIVFVGLWLTSTVFLVVLYTDQEDLKNRAKQLADQKKTAVSAEEERTIELIKAASPNGPTMVGILEDERGGIAELATGDRSNDAAVVRSRREALLKRIADDKIATDPAAFAGQPLLGVAEKLYEDLSGTKSALAEAKNGVKDLTDKVDELVKANATQKGGFDAKAQELGDQLLKAEQGRADSVKDHTAAQATAVREFERKLEMADDNVAKARAQATEAEKKVETIQGRLAVLDEQFGSLKLKPKPLATARQPDGTVLQAVPGDNMVYIDLGRDDRLVLGMKFAVYSYETGIPADGRGKGSVEVTSIFENSAECRIVELFRNEVIFPNDLIANPVYDRRKAPTFLVIGEFDLNHDDFTDPDGTAVIEALVKEWGGQVADDLTARTDFVVLGASPPKPRAVTTGGTPEEADRIEAARQAHLRYETAVAKAKDLAVPVLTQNVFLNFLGYSGRHGIK